MKAIEGFEGYFVNIDGKVFSNKFNAGHNPNRELKEKKVHINKYGYIQVTLKGNIKKQSKLVHRLIAQAFISNAENKPNVNHKNGKKNDNRLENLEWCTQKENVKHSWETKLCNSLKGENHSNVKLNKEQVLLIRNDNRSLRVIAKDYDLNYTTISNIKTKKIWKHL